MLYGECNIDNTKLKEWVSDWEDSKLLEALNTRPMLKKVIGEHGQFKQHFIDQIGGIKKAAKEIPVNELYDALTSLVSPAIMDAYFKRDNGSIRVANFYETFLLTSDLGTKKKIIQGYDGDWKEIGNIEIKNGDKIIGTIGDKSDLIWSVFYEDFVVYKECGEGVSPVHMHDHQNYLTLQLWNIDEIEDCEIDGYVQEILYNCSVKLGLNFKQVGIDPLLKEEGEPNNFSLDFKYNSIENVPLLYYNSTLEDAGIRIRFLSYYQVIEYYYIRANNILLKKELDEIKTEDLKKIRHAVKQYDKRSKENEAIKIVLSKAIDVEAFKSWINEDQYRLENFTNNREEVFKDLNIDLTKTDKEIISRLSKRIYSLRCSVVHSKADIEEIKYIPNVNDIDLVNEMPLIAYIAQRVIESWGMSSEL